MKENERKWKKCKKMKKNEKKFMKMKSKKMKAQGGPGPFFTLGPFLSQVCMGLKSPFETDCFRVWGFRVLGF